MRGRGEVPPPPPSPPGNGRWIIKCSWRRARGGGVQPPVLASPEAFRPPIAPNAALLARVSGSLLWSAMCPPMASRIAQFLCEGPSES